MVIGFVIGGLMIAFIGLSYDFTIRALPLTGGGVSFAMAALGRTHEFIAGWALTLRYSCVVALNASAVTLVFRVTFPELVTRGALQRRWLDHLFARSSDLLAVYHFVCVVEHQGRSTFQDSSSSLQSCS
ncbi:hypothetical protein ACKFR8_05575 [Corynebacterium axilliensis]|uniref:hypothetical protein n=1 Tax=Corynebacterium sp. YSMAA5_1_F9 TaxID=3383591 RepID=UPI0038D0084E